MISSLAVIYGPLAQIASEIMEEFYSHTGHNLVPLETYRSPKRQQILYDQGRTTPGKIVTNTKAWESLHQYGLAIDFIGDKDPLKTGIQNPYEIDWALLGELAARQGLRWGGSWKDYGHIEWKLPFPVEEAKKIHDEHGLIALWLRI